MVNRTLEVVGTTERLISILANSTTAIAPAVAVNLPRTLNLNRIIQWTQLQHQDTLAQPESLQALAIPEHFTRLDTGELFLLHHSRPG